MGNKERKVKQERERERDKERDKVHNEGSRNCENISESLCEPS